LVSFVGGPVHEWQCHSRFLFLFLSSLAPAQHTAPGHGIDSNIRAISPVAFAEFKTKPNLEVSSQLGHKLGCATVSTVGRNCPGMLLSHAR
jgi:hypothetical protein